MIFLFRPNLKPSRNFVYSNNTIISILFFSIYPVHSSLKLTGKLVGMGHHVNALAWGVPKISAEYIE